MAAETFTDEGLQEYLKSIGKNRVLSREEEVALFQRMEAGDNAAREELIACNLRLVVKIALQFKNMGQPVADLIQEGNVGLIHVISKFDWRKGFRFSTYAAFWIRQEVQASLRGNNSLIRLPVRKARLVGRISEAIRTINKMEGREPGVEEIAAFVGIEVEKIEAIMPMRESMLSLDAELTEDGSSLLHSIPDSGPAPWAKLDETQLHHTVRGVLDFLTDRERTIMELRFGLVDGKALSLRKTSRRVGLSQEGVRRIERRAIDKLQRPSIRCRLEGLLTA